MAHQLTDVDAANELRMLRGVVRGLEEELATSQAKHQRLMMKRTKQCRLLIEEVSIPIDSNRVWIGPAFVTSIGVLCWCLGCSVMGYKSRWGRELQFSNKQCYKFRTEFHQHSCKFVTWQIIAARDLSFQFCQHRWF